MYILWYYIQRTYHVLRVLRNAGFFCPMYFLWCGRYKIAIQLSFVVYINNSLHLARILSVPSSEQFRVANSYPRATLSENCQLRGTDNVQGQISVHIVVPNGSYCVYYSSYLFRNSWGIFAHVMRLDQSHTSENI